MSSAEYDYVAEDSKASMKAAREVREWADGNLDDRVYNDFIYHHGGLTQSDNARKVLNRIAKAYEPKSSEAPPSYIELDAVEYILKSQGTEIVQYALETGNMTLIDSLLGLINYDKDLGGVKTWAKMQSLMQDWEVLVWYFYGHMGTGKTYFARLALELWKTIYPDHRIVTNVPMEDSEYTYKYSEIKSKLEERQGKDNATRMLVFIDEAAQLFAGFGAGIQRGQDMADLIKLGRKADADFFFIGQDGKDITAALRALCTSFVHKTGKKSATFYADVHDRQGIGEQLSVDNIPLPDNPPDTKNVASLEFDIDDDEEGITETEFREYQKRQEQKFIAAMDFKSELTQKELAEIYDVDPRQIRRWKKKYKGHFESLGLL